jgi:hypothetical protein
MFEDVPLGWYYWVMGEPFIHSLSLYLSFFLSKKNNKNTKWINPLCRASILGLSGLPHL